MTVCPQARYGTRHRRSDGAEMLLLQTVPTKNVPHASPPPPFRIASIPCSLSCMCCGGCDARTIPRRGERRREEEKSTFVQYVSGTWAEGMPVGRGGRQAWRRTVVEIYILYYVHMGNGIMESANLPIGSQGGCTSSRSLAPTSALPELVGRTGLSLLLIRGVVWVSPSASPRRRPRLSLQCRLAPPGRRDG